MHDEPGGPQQFNTYSALLASAAQQLSHCLQGPVALSAACVPGCVHLLGLAIGPETGHGHVANGDLANGHPAGPQEEVAEGQQLSGAALAAALARGVYGPGSAFGSGAGVRMELSVHGRVTCVQAEAAAAAARLSTSLAGSAADSRGGFVQDDAPAAAAGAAAAGQLKLCSIWPACLTAGVQSDLLLLLQHSTAAGSCDTHSGAAAAGAAGAGGAIGSSRSGANSANMPRCRAVVFSQAGQVVADVEEVPLLQDGCCCLR